MIAHNIYIHVPFCVSKCNYCAFFSRAVAPDWESYLGGICQEIDFWATKLGQFYVPTVFFGGGTPSLMPINVFDKIMQHLRKNFDSSGCCEITLESNPGTITPEKLRDFISCGITRLSIGIQSLNDDELIFLGRRHDVKTALNLLDAAQKTNVEISADFIYGMPNHGVKNIVSMCNQINNLGLNHVSLYELTIEKNTPFGHMNLRMPTNEEMADMYIAIQNNLNLSRYEVSNYAMPGHECKHNQNIWDGGAYIGIGHGAMGRVFMDDTWYEQSGGDIQYSAISNDVRATEKIITGLRTTRGVAMTPDIQNVLDINFINSHNALVQIKNNRLCATDQGMMILDDLLVNITR